MKEFIDKLIARLELAKKTALVNVKNPVPIVFKCDLQEYTDLCFDEAIEIVNQLAEEHKDNVMINEQYCWKTCGATEHCKECNRLCNGSIDYYENYDFMTEEHNNGWISVEERLPEYTGTFICTAKGIEESLELIYSSWDNSWMDELDTEYEVIAWQPLPAPYKGVE